jgi:hypothetical protein
MAKKALKPVLKSEEKPKKGGAAAAGGAAAKPVEEKKKEGNPLDALPPTPFVVYDFKTYFVNEKDNDVRHNAFME